MTHAVANWLTDQHVISMSGWGWVFAAALCLTIFLGLIVFGMWFLGSLIGPFK